MLAGKRMAAVLLLAVMGVAVGWSAPPGKVGVRAARKLGEFRTRQGRVFKLGCLPTPKDEIARTKRLSLGVRPRAALPSAVDFSSAMPPVGDQGRQGSCTAWATAYYMKSYQEAQERGWSLGTPDHQYSPAWTYNQINYGYDGGSWPGEALSDLATKGACTLADMPYNDLDCTTWPEMQDYVAAMPARAQSYAYIWDTAGEGAAALDTVKAVLASGQPVLVAIPIYSDFDALAPDYLYDGVAAGAVYQGGHALCIVGYDDNIGGQGGFRVRNSWGAGWGNSGSGYLSYDFIATWADEAWTMVDRVGYQPQAYARIRISHSWRGDLELTTGAGAPGSPTWSVLVYQNQGGSADDINCAVDVTDAGGVSGDWWVKVRDEASGDTGSLNEFSLVFGANQVQSAQTPLTIGDFSTVVATIQLALQQVTLRVTTASGTPLGASNYITANYQQFGLPQSVQLWDGNEASVEADATSAVTFSDTSSASTSTHRWKMAVSAAPAASKPGAVLLERRYYEQYFKLFKAQTVGPPPLDDPNHVPVTHVSFGATQAARAYDAGDLDEMVWADAGTPYTYARRSLNSGARERWMTMLAASGTVSDSSPVSPTYYHQYRHALTLAGTTSPGRVVDVLGRTLFGAPDIPSPVAGLWTDWADAGSALRIANRTSGTPGRPTADPVTWTVDQAVTATVNYLPLFRIAGFVRDLAGQPLPEVQVMVGSVRTETDAAGRYEAANLPKGPYVVVPAAAGWVFNPPSRQVTVNETVGEPTAEAMSFTAIQVPQVVRWLPTGAGVNLLPEIEIYFDRPMDRLSVKQGFTLREVLAGGAGLGPELPGVFAFEPTAGGGEEVNFGPNNRLTPYRLYRVSLVGAKSAEGAPLAAPVQWTFTTGDSLGILSHSPRGQRTPLDASLFLEFDRDVNKVSLINGFSITPEAPGVWRFDGLRRAWYEFSGLLSPGVQYQVSLARNVRGTDGVTLGVPFRWEFGAEAPVQVVSTLPAADATSVSQVAPVVVTFDRVMDIEATQAAFSLFELGDPAETIPGRFSWNPERTVMTYTPIRWYEALDTYRARVSTAARGAHGAPLGEAKVWTFTIADVLQLVSFSPTGERVRVDAPIRVTFDRDVNPATLSLNITPSVAGTVSWPDAATMVFQPSAPLPVNTRFTVTVGAATAGADGVVLGSDFTWDFHTHDLVRVVSTSPRGTGIRPVQPVRIAFDQPMSRSSVESLFAMWLQRPTPERVSGAFAWEDGGRSLIFTPEGRYESLSDYRVFLPRQALSVDGVQLAANLEWVLQTGEWVGVVSFSPTGRGVSPTAPVVIRFDREMHRASAEAAFGLDVSGSFAWRDAFTMVFTPTTPWLAGARYGVSVAPAARSISGLTLGSEFAWRFTVAGSPGALAVTGVAAASAGSGAVQITYTLSASAQVQARILNMAGRAIAVVSDSAVQPAGAGVMLWSGRGLTGTKVPTGAYLVELVARDAAGGQCRSLAPLHLR